MSIPRKRSSRSIVFRITNANVLVVLSDKIGYRPAADMLTEWEGPGAVSNPKYQWLQQQKYAGNRNIISPVEGGGLDHQYPA